MKKFFKKFRSILVTMLLVVMMFTVTGCDEFLEELSAALEETQAQTNEATNEQTNAPTEAPTNPPTDAPTEKQTEKQTEAPTEKPTEKPTQAPIDKNGSYYSKEDVALYIHTYKCLPSNFITKNEAKALGWEGGSVEKFAKGKAIGGDYFGNFEGLLPKKNGRKYTECDIDTLGKSSRGAKRIIFSNDGLIYYTDDHYESFTLLYGEV